MSVIAQALWTLILLISPLFWLLRRFSAPHIVVYGSADRRPREHGRKVHFLIQNQRDVEVDGPIVLKLETDSHGWCVDHEQPTIKFVHGLAREKQPRFSSLPLEGSIAIDLAGGMRPLETWELSCDLPESAQSISLSFAVGDPGHVNHAAGKVVLGLNHPTTKLRNARLLDLGLSRTLLSFTLLVASAFGAVIATWLVTSYLLQDEGMPQTGWRETLSMVRHVPAEAAGVFLMVFLFCCLTVWLMQQAPVPIIRGHKGEVRNGAVGGTATSYTPSIAAETGTKRTDSLRGPIPT